MKYVKQAGAELCQAQVKLEVGVEAAGKLLGKKKFRATLLTKKKCLP